MTDHRQRTTNDFAMSSTAQLIDLAGRKHECLRRLYELAQRQHALIDAGEMTALLNVLAEKQRVIGDLQLCEQGLDAFRADDPARRVWSSEAERLRCANLVERSAGLLEEVLACEKLCEETLRRRRDETAEQLTTVQTAGFARHAYAETPYDGPSMLDLSSQD